MNSNARSEQLNQKGCLREDAKSRNKLTRQRLLELEQQYKSPARKAWDIFVCFLPLLCFAAAAAEYLLIPNKSPNPHMERYLILLSVPIIVYTGFLVRALWENHKKEYGLYWKLLYKAPLISVIFLLLALYDYLTLKTGLLMYPFIPWVNDVINAAIGDWKNLAVSALFSLRLLMLGYLCGVVTGLITGIACGYSTRIRYWINPLIKILGPIPTATWLPLIMLLAPSLFSGSVFIIGLGTWFSVTVATITGISTIDRSYFDAAKILGASEFQLIFRVAIPSAMPNILQGMTQGMSSACISLMVAEMMGVEAGLGWYITWSKSWAMFNRMFASIIVICIIFNVVTKLLDVIKKHALRWQMEEVK